LKTEKENEFNVRVFKKIDNKFVENELSNLKTQKIITNDYNSISKLLFRNVKVNFVNKRIPVISKAEYFSELHEKLEIVIPATENIIENPNSDKIKLIDDKKSEALITYLKKVKLVYKDEESKKNIEMLIEKVKLATNKSNNYITNDLLKQ